MVFLRFASAFVAASLLAMAAAADATITATAVIKNPITTPTVTLPASSIIDIGCFATPGPSFENHGPFQFQSPGNCQLVCLQLRKNVMATSDGENCWCADTIPAKAYRTDNSTCDTKCGGSDQVKCGGANKLWVALTGATRNKVDADPDPSASSSQSASGGASSAVPASTGTPAATTKSGGSNTIAIAVGVVVGIVGCFALGFGAWFFVRRRRQRQAEEDYRRNAANVNQFVSGGKLHTSSSSMNDSRLDPSFVDRRQSNGSIADNEDYSRRILKVTNA